MEYKVFNPYPFLYHFRDPLGTCFSIIKGSKKAIVVDTGYGIGNVRKLVESYIDTPYIVINTHGHMDHTAGNFQFDKVYCPKLDMKLFKEHNSVERRKINLTEALNQGLIDDTFNQDEYINANISNTFPLEDTTFDLGNLHVDVINMPGHTIGSIGLLIKEKRILLSGDAAILNIWMFLKESSDMNTYQNMLRETMKLPFDEFITGHIMRMFPKKYFEYFLEVSLEANPNNSEKVTFKHFERPNTFQFTKKYGSDSIGICYQYPKEN